MTHHTAHVPMHSERKPRAEFWLYFAIIFVVALPFALGFWAFAALTGREGRGPIGRAYDKAWEITPLIFSA